MLITLEGFQGRKSYQNMRKASLITCLVYTYMRSFKLLTDENLHSVVEIFHVLTHLKAGAQKKIVCGPEKKKTYKCRINDKPLKK